MVALKFRELQRKVSETFFTRIMIPSFFFFKLVVVIEDLLTASGTKLYGWLILLTFSALILS